MHRQFVRSGGLNGLIALVIAISLLGYIALALVATFAALIVWAAIRAAWDVWRGEQGRAI